MSSVRLARSLAAPPAQRRGGSGTALYWLGQAGFLIEDAHTRILIDPYLSDSLAVKYRGTPRPHIRMRPPPIAPEGLRDIDLVLISHSHTDHLDPMTLGPVAFANPACLFVVPATCADVARTRGVPCDRLIEATAFTPLHVAGVVIHPLPSAHEELVVDAQGRYAALGYVVELDGATLYHSGDCAPYPDLVNYLSPFAIDLALLPVNGRDPARAAAGIPGNFSLEEAVALTEQAGFGAALGHHFGMFDFNTIDPKAAQEFLEARADTICFWLAEAGVRYEIVCDTAKPVLRRQRA